ncbi:4223_t:CDS:2 [Dentiscutata erythropus]|uniref:4223_t:CDS:1 n=1 Tax=Dentiscutata erythropus TaxID=1348616 RepID=A0A9N9CH53_9GLOM|nr:4223_t:CDS:2 [Dentiscutata erythropus]
MGKKLNNCISSRLLSSIESKPRLIAPTPNQVSSSSTTPIDPSRFRRTYQFYPPLQSRDPTQPIINNWMMPIFSLHAPNPHHLLPSTSLNNQNHMHKCDWPGCTWSFKRLEHLKRHMITHTGERKYTCHYPGCGKKFGRSDNFAAHYKTHTKSNPRRSRKSTTSILNNTTDISALDITLPHDNSTLTNGISGIMTIQLPPPASPNTLPPSSLTQDQIDAFHYYCDTTSANTSSRPSISEHTTTPADPTLRYRECF